MDNGNALPMARRPTGAIHHRLPILLMVGARVEEDDNDAKDAKISDNCVWGSCNLNIGLG
jgi:hypothetical protein